MRTNADEGWCCKPVPMTICALEALSATFKRGRTLEELIAEQQPPVVEDLDARAADFWPEDESADDINEYIAAQRHAGLWR